LHDLSLAARFASRVVLLKGGTCIAIGRPGKVLSKDNLARAFAVETVVADCDGYPVVLPVKPLT